jgi:hypothetical protein
MGRFKYLGTTITNKKSIHEEIKSRLKSGNAYYSVQNLLSSSLLSTNINIKIELIFLAVLNRFEALSLMLRERCRLRGGYLGVRGNGEDYLSRRFMSVLLTK